MTEATLRLIQMPQNPEMERVIRDDRSNPVEQLERQNPLSLLHGTRSRATATVIHKQAVLLEAIIVNNSWRSKTKETKRIRKSQAFIDPGVANHRRTKPLGLSQIATTTAGTTGKR